VELEIESYERFGDSEEIPLGNEAPAFIIFKFYRFNSRRSLIMRRLRYIRMYLASDEKERDRRDRVTKFARYQFLYQFYLVSSKFWKLILTARPLQRCCK